MFVDITPTFIIMVIMIAAAGTIWIFTGCRKGHVPLTQAKINSSLQFSQPVKDFPPLIDRPILEFNETTTMSVDRDYPEVSPIELVDEEENGLLKAAEEVVEKVQDVVNHIASNPPNPEEVFTKIRHVLRQYHIFKNTEYYEAINSFVAVTVERDCSIQLTKEQIPQLWN